jgi:hypothetical protein
MLALSFDLDYQEDTAALPGLVDLVGRAGVRMTLFCIGRLVEQNPGPYRDAANAAHEIANHTWSHPDNPVLNPDREFWYLTIEEMSSEIGLCQDVLERHTSVRPSGFRSPHFKDAFRMMHALHQFPEIAYISTTLASRCPLAVPYFPAADPWAHDLSLNFAPRSGVRLSQLMIPLTPCPGLRWSPFCSYSSIRRPTNPAKGAGLHSIQQWEQLWDKMLKRAEPLKFASVYFDPMDVMRDEDTRGAFERMLLRATERGWKVTTLADVAKLWRSIAEDAHE